MNFLDPILIYRTFRIRYNLVCNMLKRFRKSFFNTEKQNIFTGAGLNIEHTPMNLCKLGKIVKILQNCEQLDNGLKTLQKCIQQNNRVIKFKALMACHYLFKKLGKKQILAILSDVQIRGNYIEANKLSNQSQDYIQTAIITPYKQYLENLYFKEEIYSYVHKFSAKDQLEHIQIFSKGFQCLNLMEKILRTRESMSKVARYYPNYFQYNTLYLLYVQDLLTFNSYIKWSANKIITYFHNDFEKEYQMKKNQDFLRQMYIFLTESQRISDLLKQFYFNQYYYQNIKINFHLPILLNIKMEIFDQLKSKIRVFDLAFYKSVRPKKRVNHGKNRHQLYKTQVSIGELHNLSLQNNNLSVNYQEHIISFQLFEAV